MTISNPPNGYPVSLIEKNFFGTGHGASIGSLGPGSAWLTNITVSHAVVSL